MWIPARICGGSVTAMVVSGVLLAAVADYLFFEHPIGWTAGLFLALWAMLIALKRPRRAAIVMLVLLAGLVIAMLEQPSPLAVLLAALGLISLAAAVRSGWTSRVRVWVLRWGWYAIGPVAAPLCDIVAMNRWQKRHPHANARWTTGLLKWVLPVCFGLVFVGLFWLANPIIAEWMTSLRLWLADWFDVISSGRILLWLSVMLGAWVLWRQRALKLRAMVEDEKPEAGGRWIDQLLPTGVVVRCLVLFNVIFAVQTVLDLRYLWGGAALPTGMTYAQYAHRGAYPLVATALLAGLFVMTTFRAGGAAERSRTARQLVYLWIVQNLMLLAAAIWRLDMYVDAYNLTRWRIAAGIWMGMVAIGFVLTIWRIVSGRNNAWLGRACAGLLLAVLYACAFVNFDGFIADYNVRHCAEVRGEGVAIDLEYMEQLGVETLPALFWLMDNTVDRSLQHQTTDLIGRLHRQLKHDLSNWRGWTCRRWRIVQSLPVVIWEQSESLSDPFALPAAHSQSDRS